MPEANEAPDPQVNYEDEATAELASLVNARAAEIAAEESESTPEPVDSEESAPVAQAEEATASGESDDVEEAPTPDDGDAVPEATDDSPDLDWAPDELREPISHLAGKATPEQLASIKKLMQLGDGAYTKMREAAQQRKDNEALIAAGEQFNKLFDDERERDLYLSWREQHESGAKPTEALDPESFETDADLIRYAEERAVKAAERRFQELHEQKYEAPRAAAESFNALLIEHHETTGVPEEVYIEAAGMLNAKLRKRGIDPVKHLTDIETINDELEPYLKLIALQGDANKRTAEAIAKNESSKSQAARSASASSPVGRSTRAKVDTPDTPDGLAARTLAEFHGREILDF